MCMYVCMYVCMCGARKRYGEKERNTAHTKMDTSTVATGAKQRGAHTEQGSRTSAGQSTADSMIKAASEHMSKES